MLLLASFFGGSGVLLLFIHDTDKKTIAIIGGISLIISAIYLYISYIKNTPKITITNRDIRFNNESFKIEDIQRIDFSEKSYFSYCYEKEASTLVFKNGVIKHIFDDMYSNTSKMKSALDYLINNNKRPAVYKVHTDLSSEHFYKYKGYFIYSFRGIMYLLFMSLFTFLLLTGKPVNPASNYILVSFLLFFTLLFSWQFNYFEVNNNYFRIRNHMKLWKNDTYKIEDIKKVTFQSQGKAANIMKIFFKDHTTKKYTAATLSNSNWKELQQALKKLNIKVINYL